MNGFIQFKTQEGVSAARPDPAQWVLDAGDVAVWHQAQMMLAQAQEQAARIRTEAAHFYESEKQRGYAEGQELVQFEQIDRMIDVAGKTVDYFAGMEQRVVMQSKCWVPMRLAIGCAIACCLLPNPATRR